MKRLFVILALSLSVSAAHADVQRYLQFNQGSSTPVAVWMGPPSGALPAGAVTLPWTPVNGDENSSDYQLQNGAIVYAPPAAPIVPDVRSFKAKINQDYMAGMLPVAAYQCLAQWAAPMQDLVAFPPVLQKAWQDLKTTHAADLGGNYPNVAPYNGAAIVDQIETYAAEFDVPLK